MGTSRENEKRIVHVLTRNKLSRMKMMLEKDHAIDCIFLLMLGKGQWKDAKEFMRKLGLSLPDGTFRARMLEIEENGLARHENIDLKKRRWVATEYNNRVGRLLLDLFDSMAG